MYIEISTQRLNVDIRQMSGELDQLQGAVTRVYNSLEELNGMWEGPANRSFYAQTQIDRMVCEDLLSDLHELVECLEYAKDEYQECREAVNSKIRSMRLSSDT